MLGWFLGASLIVFNFFFVIGKKHLKCNNKKMWSDILSLLKKKLRGNHRMSEVKEAVSSYSLRPTSYWLDSNFTCGTSLWTTTAEICVPSDECLHVSSTLPKFQFSDSGFVSNIFQKLKDVSLKYHKPRWRSIHSLRTFSHFFKLTNQTSIYF